MEKDPNRFFTAKKYRDNKQQIAHYSNEVFKKANPYGDYDVSGYYVSNYGRIYNNDTNLICAQSHYSNGYVRSKVHCRDILVHRLVMSTFNPVNGMNDLEVNHIDGNKDNNFIDNLEWVTHKENQIHAVKHNLIKSCESDKKSVYSNDQAHQVCKILESGETDNPTEICKKIGLKPNSKNISFVSNIKSKREWKQISNQYNF